MKRKEHSVKTIGDGKNSKNKIANKSSSNVISSTSIDVEHSSRSSSSTLSSNVSENVASTSSSNSNKTNSRISIEDIQNASKADGTRKSYATGCRRFVKWVEKDNNVLENSVIIDGAEDVHKSLDWNNIPWKASEHKVSNSAYLFEITYNEKEDKMFKKSVPEIFWALYTYSLKKCKLEVDKDISSEFYEYLSGYKRNLAMEAERSNADKTTGKDPLSK